MITVFRLNAAHEYAIESRFNPTCSDNFYLLYLLVDLGGPPKLGNRCVKMEMDSPNRDEGGVIQPATGYQENGISSMELF